MPLRVSPGNGVDSLAEAGEAGQGEGKFGGHEGTDVGQLWEDRRVQRGRDPRPLEVLGQGQGM